MFEQECVREFHIKFQHPAPEKPTLEHFRFWPRVKWTIEEALEFAHACGFIGSVSIDVYGDIVYSMIEAKPIDWPKMIDALIDLRYFVDGSFVEMGVDSDPHFSAVHTANMAKCLSKNADGKTIKPEGWKPPDIKAILDAQLAGDRPERSEAFELRDIARSLLMSRDESSARFEAMRARAWEAEQKLAAVSAAYDAQADEIANLKAAADAYKAREQKWGPL